MGCALVLLDPLDEQFDLPALLVPRSDGQERLCFIASKEDQGFARFGILKADALQMPRIVLRDVKTVQDGGLITDRAGVVS